MADFFSGQLLEYRVEISRTTIKNQSMEEDLKEMIKIRPQYERLHSQFIEEGESYKKIRVKPFEKSSIILDEYVGYYRNISKLTLQFITRDFTFYSYDLSYFATDASKINLLYKVSLNKTTLQNAECRDLLYHKRKSRIDENFFFFCRYLQEV